MEPPLWTEGASAYPHEREALAFVRTRLPNHEPWRAWSNVEFIAEDGSVNEVDLLVVAPNGLFLVEIKSHPGTLFGDGQRWRLRFPDGGERFMEHPLISANRKAKRLRSLLARQKALNDQRVPFVNALVFMSSPELDCRLHGVGRLGVCGRDAASPTPGATAALPTAVGNASAFPLLNGIVAALKDPSTAGLRGTAVNRPLSAGIAQALVEAGLHPANRGRKVGDWELGSLLDEGPGWQDFAASRPRMSVARRARVYLCGAATTKEDEARLRSEAEREFRLVQGLSHVGIAQPLDLVQAERGPALLFDREDGEQRLDLWAPDHLGAAMLEERIDLVRQLAEAVAHAHAQRVTHRALTPRCILVRPSATDGTSDGGSKPPRLLIGHWQAGARELASRLTRHSTTSAPLGADLIARMTAEEHVYLAPELFSAEDPDGVAIDVFSLGAIAALILSGVPPAGDLSERQGVLATHEGLTLDALADSAPDSLRLLVNAATHPVASRRATVRDVLDLLDAAFDEITSPELADEELQGDVDPLAAGRSDHLEGGWRVLRRLGSGSTAVALLCTREGLVSPQVLKVARDEEHDERMRDEARTLESLDHQGIVQLLGIERVHGRTTLRLAPAGDPAAKVGMTLADRLVGEGRIGLDLLERFGTDLLEIVDYLEGKGVSHRDIKPDNLGVRPRAGDRSLHLVLFDFSLSRTPDANLRAGTQGYLDPFLAERPQRRWDPAAERYAAAATLHEMATGSRPRWGDGRSDPLHLDDQVPTLDPAAFDPAMRDGLVEFFSRALHRDPERRFHTAGEMLRAWRTLFADVRRPTTEDDGEGSGRAAREALIVRALSSTPVGELGLSPSAVAALERVGVITFAQLRELAPADWARTPGVGEHVRREVADLLAMARARVEAERGADPAASIDRLADQLVPKPGTTQAASDELPTRVLLGLQDAEDEAPGPTPSQPGLLSLWPGMAEVTAEAGLDRRGYEELLDRARARWAKKPMLTEVRRDIEDLLVAAGGVLAAEDIALGLLAQRGSTATGAKRRARARAVVRAALETDSFRSGSRFTWRRVGGASAAAVALRSDSLDAEELADYAASLGVAADRLAADDPLPSPAAVVEQLRQVAMPPGLAPLPDHRLVRLAAGSSATAAASSRLELYPRQLSPERSVRLARAALLAGILSEEEVRARVHRRFPEAAPLPARPELDALLEEVVGLQWVHAGILATGAPHPPGFRLPPSTGGSALTAIGSSGARFRTGTVVTGVPEEARRAADNAEDRLQRHARRGGYLVISVHPSQYLRSIAGLANLGAATRDMDELLIETLRTRAGERGIDWERAILLADAQGPEGPRWSSHLLPLIREALDRIYLELLHGPPHVLLVNVGLLARYESLGVLDRLYDALRRPAESGQTLEALWVLVPADDLEALPALAGRPVPVAGPAEHLALPDEWALNLQHTALSKAPA